MSSLRISTAISECFTIPQNSAKLLETLYNETGIFILRGNQKPKKHSVRNPLPTSMKEWHDVEWMPDTKEFTLPT